MDTDAAGNVHLSWMNSNQILYTNNATGSFSPPINLATGLAESNPSLAAEPNGSVHIAWQVYDQMNEYAIYYTSNRGGTFPALPLIVQQGITPQRNPSLAVDGDGHAYLTCQVGVAGSGSAEIVFSGNEAGGFIGPLPVSDNSAGDDFDSSIVVDGNGNAHIAWEGHDGDDWEIYYASDVGGIFTTNRLRITDNDVFDNVTFYDRTLAISGVSGAVAIAYWSNNEIWLAHAGDIFPPNLSPSADADGPYMIAEGETITFDGSASSDPDMDGMEYRWDFENDGIFDTQFSGSPTAAKIFGDNSAGQVLLEVRDVPAGLTDSDVADFSVANVEPMVVVGALVPPRPEFTLPGEVIEFTGSFADPGWEDTHTASWNFGDGTFDPGTFSNLENDPPETTGDTAASHAFGSPGLYIVRLSVTDDDGGTGFAEEAVEIASGEEATHAIDEAIQDLDNSAFKHPAASRKNAFSNKLQEVQDLISAGEFEAAIDKLQDDIAKKMDGCIGGNSKNDWITDCDAQAQLADLIDALVSYLEAL